MKTGKQIKFIDGNMIEYEIFKLVDKYDPILRKPTEDIDFEEMPGNKVAYLSLSMMETLNHIGGLGLAANQVGLSHSIIVLNTGDRIMSMINPKIIYASENKSSYQEGCLSFPGLYLKINRPQTIEVEFQGANGDKVSQRYDGLTATCIMHEIDHLKGIVFTDLVPKVILQRQQAKIKSNRKRLSHLQIA